MTNNDILRRIRYTFNLTDTAMVNVFAAAEHTVTTEQVIAWLTKEGEEAYTEISDTEFATFLNGFINTQRGKREGEQPAPESKLNNNIIFMKLRIALNMKAEDVIATLALVDFNLSKHELSAFSRKVDNKHYRVCNNQVLRLFLTGVQQQVRPQSTAE
ncbi:MULTISPECIES: DUF1456 family protein [Pseudoalteromonas]|uniref:Uncharacterized protein n=1 Tax=Pseudoalteromonas nigrifaciens TaxID=28109 RepID=A0AAC9UHY5_9GAMM|nr:MULTISPECIES: DUF1456 family protein [Pseudoalteromonas]ASM53946.1 hypothetical protein PNIG_a1854 [Pseudoalteromonas nigrifaciens]MBE0421735.1 DUF1456 family protein [Pseudoalteromonas nigrifaciens]MBO7926063.1 DUF1456 family protein [Pseudoalteromonas sp. K222D]SUC52217.1 Protein of uncharacterised function (DUF1456) [Pseudoalteromonas nigrifaciens]GEN41422.1 DUF1456 domain-containing protein [Pseudoalteromonas nigrifaciens]